MDKRRPLADRTEFHWRQVKKNGREMSICRSVAFFTALALGHYGLAVAGPTGGVVTRGSGTIEQVGPRTDIEQATRRLDIDWTTFSTRANESVNFHQPDRLSTAVNRVVGGVPSELRGALNANGRVFIINRSGITFHGTSQVNVGALLATTAGRMSGEGDSLRFDDAAGAVINHGRINVSDGGFALLVAPDVTNTGYIQADLGQVALASGKGFSIDLRGDGLISFKVDDEVVGTVVNAGVVRARSGIVQLTAADAQDAVAGVINMGGVIDADAIAGGPAGKVLVHGGDANISGDISADGPSGGEITITGDRVSLTGADVSASGPGGGGDVLIGGDYQGKGDTYRARTTNIDAQSRVSADATANGDGGYVIVWSDGTTSVHGSITARGGPSGGDGGFIETSGKKELVFTRSADASAPHGAPGTWLLDPENIDIGRGEADAIEGSLNQGNNVSIKTSSEGEGEGNIAVNASITKSEGGDAGLSMDAHGQIDVNAPIKSTSGKLDVNLTAAKAVNVNSAIETNGGNVNSRVTGVSEAPAPEETESVEIVDATGETPDDGGSTVSGEDAGEGEETTTDAGDDESTAEALADAEAAANASSPSGSSPADSVDDEPGDASEDPAPQPDLRPSFSLGGSIKTGGGDVSIESIDGVANIDGVIDASNPAQGEIGGHVEIFADEINLGDDAVVDVSGEAGGGTILIGGDYQGGGDKPTATKTTVAKGAELRADATGNGDGGTIVVWADDTTVFRGTASARGGAEGGDGGFVEVSGKRHLVYRGVTDTRAPKGETGLLLLDPDRIVIAEGSGTDDSLTSAANTATVYEKNLESQFTDILLSANKEIKLENLNDETPSNTMDADGILDIKATELKLQVTGSNGKIHFEDLNDTIRVNGGKVSRLIIDGGTSNSVAVNVGHLETIASGTDASALIDIGAGGPISTRNITAIASATDSGVKTDADARVLIRSGEDILIDGDVLVTARAFEGGNFSGAVDAKAILDVTASGDANIHDSNARLTITGDVEVHAEARQADSEAGVYLAGALAVVDLKAAGDVWVQGNDDDDGAIEISALARASSEFAFAAYGQASLAVEAGAHVDSNSSDNGGIRIDGDVVMDAEAFLRGDHNDIPGAAIAAADAKFIAPDDAKSLDSNDEAFDGQSGILIDGDITIDAATRVRGVDDFDPKDFKAYGAAFAYLDVFAGSHSSGEFEITGNIALDAYAESLDVDQFFYFFPSVIAIASADIYAADKVDLGGDVTVEAEAKSAGAPEFDPKENDFFFTGGDRNGDAFAAAYLGVRAGVTDPNWNGNSASASKFEHNSNADIRIGGNVGIHADAIYRGDAFGRAISSAHGFLEAAEDITLEGDITVTSVALSSGTGPVYRDEKNAQSLLSGKGFDDTYDHAYLADDASAHAHLQVWAGMHSDGSLVVDGNVTVSADATMLNGSMAAKFNDGDLVYLDRAEANAYGTASFYAADKIHFTNENGVISVAAHALGSGELNGGVHGNVDLYLQAGGPDPRWKNSNASVGTHSHGSNGSLIRVDGEISLEASAEYYGNAGLDYLSPFKKGPPVGKSTRGEADAHAHAYLVSAGGIDLNGDIKVTADALSSAREFEPMPKANDVFDHNDFELMRGLYLGVGAPSADAHADFEAISGIHSSGAFDLDGTFTVKANADVNSNVTGFAEYFNEKGVSKKGFGTAVDKDDYDYLFMRSKADADADVKIRAATDLNITGTVIGSSNTATQQALFVDANANVDGQYMGDAKAEVKLYLEAGLHDSNGSVDIKGDATLQADATYRGDTYGSAEAKIYGKVYAAQDIVIDGDMTLHTTALSSGTSDPYDNKILGGNSNDAGKYRLADDAVARIYLKMIAGLHSSGSLDIKGDINIVADAEMLNGSFAWDKRDDNEDSVEADARVEVKLYAADKVHLSGDNINVAAYARGVGEFNGAADATADFDIKAGGLDPFWKGSNGSASTHSHGSNGEILIETNRVSVIADAEYSGNAYGHADADVDIDWEATENITIRGDVFFSANAVARGVQLDDPVRENDFVYENDSKKLEKRGDYLGVGDAKAEVEVDIYAGSHSSGAFVMDGTLEVRANAEVSSNIGDVDSNLSMLAYLEKKDGGYQFDKKYSERNAKADAKLSIKAADDIIFEVDDVDDDSLRLITNAKVDGEFLENAKTYGSATLWAGYHSDSNTTDNGDLDIGGNVFMSVDANYSGNAFGSADAKVYGKFRAARDITIDGDLIVRNHARADGTGTAYSDNSLGDDRLAEKAHSKTYLSVVAGLHSSGDLTIGGDVDVKGSAELFDAAFNKNSEKDAAQAFVNVYLYAADNVLLEGSNIAVTGFARSKGEFNDDAKADVEFKVFAGDKDPLFDKDHGSNGSITIDAAGGVLVSASAQYEGNGGGDAWADVKMKVKSAGDITIDNDVTVVANAKSQGATFGDPFENIDKLDLANDFDDKNWIETRDNRLGVGNATASASFQAVAGSHSSGSFEMNGRLRVGGDAEVDSNLNALIEYYIEEKNKFPTRATASADVLVDIGAADDIIFESSTDAIDVFAKSDVDGIYLGQAKSIAYLDVQAGKHVDSNEVDVGNVSIDGDLQMELIAQYEGDKQGFAEAKGTVNIKAKADIDIDGDIYLDVDVDASGTGGFNSASDYAGAKFALARMDVSIKAGTHSGGDANLSGSLLARTDARLVDGSRNAAAYTNVDIDAAHDVLLEGGDFEVLANAETIGLDVVKQQARNEEFPNSFSLPSGSNSPFPDDLAKTKFFGSDAHALFDIRAGVGEHEGNSSASLTIEGDVRVEATVKYDVYGLDYNHGDLGDENDVVWDGGAHAKLITIAAGDITIEGNISVSADANAEVAKTGPFAHEAENATAFFFAYAGSHSSGDFSHDGNLTVSAQAGNSNAVDTKTGESFDSAFALSQSIIGAANDITISGDIKISAMAMGDDAKGGAKASADLQVLAALHGENSAQSGDIFVGGGVDVMALASAEHGDIKAVADLLMNAANSHDGFNDDLTVNGPITVTALGRDGGGPSDQQFLRASIRLYAGDDVILNGGPPVARAADITGFGSNFALCGPGPCFTGTDSTTVGSGSSQNFYQAIVDIFGHEGFDDPVPEIPEIPEIPPGGGGGGVGFTPPPPTPPIPPLPPELQEIVLRTVVGWLEAIVGDPEMFLNLPPGLLEDITIGAGNQVTFTQSFFDVIFPRIFNSDLRDIVPWPEELIDFLEANYHPPDPPSPDEGVVMVDTEDSS